MDQWTMYMAIVAVAALALAVALHHLRRSYLQRTQLGTAQHEDLRIQALEYIKRETYKTNQVVSLEPFWRSARLEGRRVREPDRRAVLAPLFDERILVLMRATDTLGRLANYVSEWITLPTWSDVVLSEREFLRMSNGTPASVIIEELRGDFVMGPKVGRDYIGKDKVGKDKVRGNKAGRDSDVLRAGHNLTSVTVPEPARQNISTEQELAESLTHLAGQARSRGCDEETVGALLWAAGVLRGEESIDARSQARAITKLHRPDGWLKGALSAVLSGVSGAAAKHWLVELMRG